jgi:hypothetical protein
VAFVPDHPSPDCPPLATQLVAFVAVQVKVTGLPTAIEVGEADKVTVGTVTVTATGVAASVTEFATQFKP